MSDPFTRDVLTVAVTVHGTQRRVDLENSFIVRHLPELTARFVGRFAYFHFVRHWAEDDEYGDAILLRFKVNSDAAGELGKEVYRHLKASEAESYVERVWEPRIETDEEVFGSAPSLGSASAYGALWCFLDATCRTAMNLLSLDREGRLDLPEWVIADLWVDFFYNALGVPDFVGCLQCGAASAMRIPRCHACGSMPEIRHPKPARGL